MTAKGVCDTVAKGGNGKCAGDCVQGGDSRHVGKGGPSVGGGRSGRPRVPRPTASSPWLFNAITAPRRAAPRPVGTKPDDGHTIHGPPKRPEWTTITASRERCQQHSAGHRQPLYHRQDRTEGGHVAQRISVTAPLTRGVNGASVYYFSTNAGGET